MTCADQPGKPRYYRVAGPYFLAPGEAPPEGLEVIVEASETIVCDIPPDFESPEVPDAPARWETLLSSMGAAALLDCRRLPGEDGVCLGISGRPAVVARRSSLGRETRETLAAVFHPLAGKVRLLSWAPPVEPFDVWRPILAIARVLGLLFLSAAAAFIILVALEWVRRIL